MNIFISYRRQDSEWFSNSLYTELKKHLPPESVFKDVNDIPKGSDYTKVIETRLKNCDVLLVVIGSEWLHIKDEAGNERLFLPDDVACLEVATALKFNKIVMPVLIQGTKMPGAEELPPSIAELSKRQSTVLGTANFELDVFNLANAIQQATGQRNQYAEMVKGIAVGQVSQKELIKPESNSTYAVFCTLFGLLILYLNSDSVPFVLVCLVIIGAGVYAYFQSRKVTPLWLNKQFEEARNKGKNVRLISLIAPGAGTLMLIVIILAQLFGMFANGDANKILDVVKKLQDSVQQNAALPGTPANAQYTSEPASVPIHESTALSEAVKGDLISAINLAGAATQKAWYTLYNTSLYKSYTGEALKMEITNIEDLKKQGIFVSLNLEQQDFKSFTVSAGGTEAAVRLVQVWSGTCYYVLTQTCSSQMLTQSYPQTIYLKKNEDGWMITSYIHDNTATPAFVPCNE